LGFEEGVEAAAAGRGVETGGAGLDEGVDEPFRAFEGGGIGVATVEADEGRPGVECRAAGVVGADEGVQEGGLGEGGEDPTAVENASGGGAVVVAEGARFDEGGSERGVSSGGLRPGGVADEEDLLRMVGSAGGDHPADAVERGGGVPKIARLEAFDLAFAQVFADEGGRGDDDADVAAAFLPEAAGERDGVAAEVED
jgi:hypothetical protein